MKIVVLTDSRSGGRAEAYQNLSAIGVLAALLRRAGYEVATYDTYELNRAERSEQECRDAWAERKSAVDDCDAFVAFAYDSWMSMIDLGYALGMKKPTVLLTNRGGDDHVTEFGATICNSLEELFAWLESLKRS